MGGYARWQRLLQVLAMALTAPGPSDADGFRRKHEVYTMQWKLRNLGDYIVAGARYGGPIGAPDRSKESAFQLNGLVLQP